MGLLSQPTDGAHARDQPSLVALEGSLSLVSLEEPEVGLGPVGARTRAEALGAQTLRAKTRPTTSLGSLYSPIMTGRARPGTTASAPSIFTLKVSANSS